MNQVCINARDNGMLNDPRITFDSEPPTENCGFKYKNNFVKRHNFPKVCGNCKDYSVQ